jgi:hypothetical protein
MIYVTIALLALAAVLGLTILFKWLAHKNSPRAVVYSHGLVTLLWLTGLISFIPPCPELP